MIKKKKEFIRFKEVTVGALNVRTYPSTTKGLIVKILPLRTVVECDEHYDNPEWDHIVADPDIEGYVMKRFLIPATPDTLAEFGKEPIIISKHEPKCDGATNDKENKDDNKEKEE